MKAALLQNPLQPLRIVDAPDPLPAQGRAVVRLHAAALNHRDLWIWRGAYPNITFPVIPGSDGAGVVESVGPDADPALIGREVVIYPITGWGDQPRAHGPQFRILGMPDPGTLAQKVAVHPAQLYPKPNHLSFEETAALPVAGLTAHRALFARGDLTPSDRVLITGIGGGVALFALQLATAAGARAWVTSSSDDKIRRAIQLGASGAARYDQPGDLARLASETGGFDLIIDGAGGPGMPDLIQAAAPGARLVTYGATCGNPAEIPLRALFSKQIDLRGTMCGSPADFAAFLHLVSALDIHPVLHATLPLDSAHAALTLLDARHQFGKIVLTP